MSQFQEININFFTTFNTTFTAYIYFNFFKFIVNHIGFRSVQVNFEFEALQSTFPKLGFVFDLFTGFKIPE